MQAIETELDELIGLFQQGSTQQDAAMALESSLGRIKQFEKQINGEINRHQKLVPKAPAAPPVVEPTPELESMLQQEIASWLLRADKPAIARLLASESSHEIDLVDLSECFDLCSSLENQELEPALEWAKTCPEPHRPGLQRRLHELQFNLLARSDKLAAITYLRQNIHYNARSPLVLGLVAPVTVDVQGAVALVKQMYMQSIGQSPTTGLQVAAEVGLLAIEKLAKSHALHHSAPASELPVEIELPPQYYYHQIFVCPVSKQQTTRDNPPMLLPCRHILAAESVKSLLENCLTRAVFKCPYCPKTASLVSTTIVSIGEEL